MSQWLAHIFEVQEVRAAVISIIVAAFTGAVGKILTARPKINWGVINQNNFLVPQNTGNPLNVLTLTFTVANNGRRMAEDVEIVLNWEPQHIEYFPHLPVARSKNSDGRYVLTLNRLNPKEFINFSMLSANAPLPDITYVRASGYAAKMVRIAPQRIFSKWFNSILIYFMVAGFVSTIYFIVLTII